ncbi:hypothetical protein ACTJLC_14175 [Paraburkholderia sp. 22099]|jgi:hypothetical protein|uniref:hypothetical protein n=1 Tax=Paraburkholderia TaxID=1822464 RepID=UPI002857838E|nr:hypothetical protein [Paraburkholderia terricola]MDR6492664.1 hypothetical protein [Paraburkholderia terricola]
MNRPLALIEGDLALPSARSLAGLPPPYGSGRRPVQARREPQPAALTAAQRAIQDAVQRAEPLASRGRLPSDAKYIFLYKAPQRRDYSYSFDAQLAEARRYLDAGKQRSSSSRADHMAGAAIFVSCSIALAWLLITSATPDADSATTLAATLDPVTRADVRHSEGAVKLTQPVVETASTSAERAPAAASSVPTTALASSTAAAMAPATRAKNDSVAAKAVPPAKPAQLVRADAPRVKQPLVARATTHGTTTNRLAKVDRKAAIARLSETQVDKRLALTRSARPASQPSISQQPEWIARASANHDSAEQAALLEWAKQQRAKVTTRASTPVPGNTDWNARMTQRRITDNPDAFRSDFGPK